MVSWSSRAISFPARTSSNVCLSEAWQSRYFETRCSPKSHDGVEDPGHSHVLTTQSRSAKSATYSRQQRGPNGVARRFGVPGGRIISKESLFSSRGIVHQQGNDCGAVDLAQEDSESLGPGGTGLCRSGVGWPDGGHSATARRRRVPRSDQQEDQEDRADPGADRSEERRVGKECRCEGLCASEKKN